MTPKKYRKVRRNTMNQKKYDVDSVNIMENKYNNNWKNRYWHEKKYCISKKMNREREKEREREREREKERERIPHHNNKNKETSGQTNQ